MPASDQEDARTYLVVVNAEEQYSIWPVDKKMPAGWSAVGKQGSKSECLESVEEVWTDMRPLTLRQRMDGAAGPPNRTRFYRGG
ncbi:MAG: MbtH family NRPS accessory protein [Bradyrhizobium sp.]|uniref:MbtH family protein n=1 Tax=Bradyrhizobium sp. TaxID=376 RepID=UPI001C29E37F|nr:MbtH family NRPS accessory protein [Bradyrhizobium sp.]MBU6463205.1 MbtH family NRPS accessory protein [Pseudomonadota bacterium]MDE2067012.1 MbtH family NRPS accessory protein [Bradyrhizobium sp.]MDE2472121.1 MbtH family NRPS accessory protein [Bradyrhizobium sp.]